MRGSSTGSLAWVRSLMALPGASPRNESFPRVPGSPRREVVGVVLALVGAFHDQAGDVVPRGVEIESELMVVQVAKRELERGRHAFEVLRW